MEFAIQLIIILICLFYGARKGGIALGLLGGIGLVILVFVFHLQPGKPPVDVMLVIIAVVAAGHATGVRRAGCHVTDCREAAAAQPEICFNRRAFRHLHADHSLRYRTRGVHDPADYLRCRH